MLGVSWSVDLVKIAGSTKALVEGILEQSAC